MFVNVLKYQILIIVVIIGIVIAVVGVVPTACLSPFLYHSPLDINSINIYLALT